MNASTCALCSYLHLLLLVSGCQGDVNKLKYGAPANDASVAKNQAYLIGNNNDGNDTNKNYL